MSDRFECAYLVVEVADRGAFEHFMSSALALPTGQPSAFGETSWRIDAKAYRVLAYDGPANDVHAVGYEFPDSESLGRAVGRLDSVGAHTVAGTPELIAARRVKELVIARSPWGVPLELVTGLAEAEPFVSDLHPAGFTTGDHGMGHVVFFVEREDFAASRRFITEGLGMVLTDFVEIDGHPARGEFFHANGRHHSTALISVPSRPRKLNHFMIEATELDDVGRTFDRVVPLGLPIPMGLGRHENDKTFSFYAETPAGFDVEFGHGGVTVDDDWPAERYDKVSVWGHQPYQAADPATFAQGRPHAVHQSEV